ncbi:MAG: TraB/GumN family protein [Bacteroidota bacterium]
MKRFFLPFFLLIVAITSDAQQAAKWPKTLLWKISGNNLVKPSFLYGTMHLQDKRLFHFGDSLYHYLEQVDGYALEIDLQEFMDSIIQRAIDQSRDEFIEKRKLKTG